jgi:hypothetical protein
MDAQFDHAFAHRLAITEITRMHSAQPHTDSCLSILIAHRMEPFAEWYAAILALIAKQLDHEHTVAYKLLVHQQECGGASSACYPLRWRRARSFVRTHLGKIKDTRRGCRPSTLPISSHHLFVHLIEGLCRNPHYGRPTSGSLLGR